MPSSAVLGAGGCDSEGGKLALSALSWALFTVTDDEGMRGGYGLGSPLAFSSSSRAHWRAGTAEAGHLESAGHEEGGCLAAAVDCVLAERARCQRDISSARVDSRESVSSFFVDDDAEELVGRKEGRMTMK